MPSPPPDEQETAPESPSFESSGDAHLKKNQKTLNTWYKWQAAGKVWLNLAFLELSFTLYVKLQEEKITNKTLFGWATHP